MIPMDAYPALYQMLQAPVVAGVNCGDKCSEWNNGTPVCCTNHTTMPVLYTSEYEYLKDKKDREGNQKWTKFEPRPDSPEDKKLILTVLQDEVLATCTGPSRCKRENRSLVCRTFPFSPYFTESGVFVGMTHHEDYDESCWVLMNDHLTNPDFVREFEAFWLKVFSIYPAEILSYRESSSIIRDTYKERGVETPVILFENALVPPDEGTRVVHLEPPI